MRELIIILNCVIYGLQVKSLKSFSTDFICFVCLILLGSQLLRFCLFGWDWSIDLLVRYSRPVFHSILWTVFQDLSCYVFLLRRIKKCFALPHFAAFSTFCVKSFDFSRLVSLFSHSAKSDFEHQLLIKAIQYEQSQYKN